MFGVEVLKGTIKPGYRLMFKGKVVGEIRELQAEGENRKEAKIGERLAVSMDNVTVGKDFSEGDELVTHYTTDTNMKRIEKVKHLLRIDEKQLLEEGAKNE